jgi:hypothetical protein
LPDPADARGWFDYLTSLKDTLGILNNSIGFVATLLARAYLESRFDLERFDASEKAQEAPGPGIAVRTKDGKLVRCEIKTTRPYQGGFGFRQKAEIKKDLKKLGEATADHKLMLVTDAEAFSTLCKPYYASHAQDTDIVNLLTRETFRH